MECCKWIRSVVSKQSKKGLQGWGHLKSTFARFRFKSVLMIIRLPFRRTSASLQLKVVALGTGVLASATAVIVCPLGE